MVFLLAVARLACPVAASSLVTNDSLPKRPSFPENEIIYIIKYGEMNGCTLRKFCLRSIVIQKSSKFPKNVIKKS